MRLPPPLPLNLRLWFGVLGAPFAWATQHVTGFALTQARCGAIGTRHSIAFDGLTLAIAAAGASIAAAAGLSALTVFRETRGAQGVGGDEEDPPLGRIHFLATVALVTTPLFFAMMVMSGLGALFLEQCQQG